MEFTDQPGHTKSRRLRVIEVLLSLMIFLIVTTMLLWNWDGFWQTKIPLLVNTQKTYFPVKYGEEQNKLANGAANTKRWVEALVKIEALEKELSELNQDQSESKKAATKAEPTKK